MNQCFVFGGMVYCSPGDSWNSCRAVTCFMSSSGGTAGMSFLSPYSFIEE
ncbi:hypothetical protein VSK92_15965 [Bacillus swezeyi]